MQTNQLQQKKRRRAQRAIRRRGARIPVSWVLAALFVVFMIGGRLADMAEREAHQLQQALKDADITIKDMEARSMQLKNELDRAGTPEFIATEARTKYGYLTDGEIRFVVTNPEVLWGEGGIPPEFQTPAPR